MQKKIHFKNKFFGLLLIAVHALQAQIINVESLRMVTDTTGWSGTVQLQASLKKNVNEQFKIGNHIHIQYKLPKHLFLFVNHLGFERIDGSDFTNDAMQHLRYNYKFAKKWTAEAFIQNQFNAVSKIEYRRLGGMGLRWKLTQSEKYKFYLGNHVMYEEEKTKEDNPHHNKAWRNSAYLSFSLYFNDHTSLISTTYFQPNFRNFNDYRTSHQSALKFKVFKNLAFVTTFNFAYDEFPVTGIPQKEYELSNGLVYTFD